jgi:hypothetical protein
MLISNFDDLLQTARYETLPQRLLFVFVATELPTDCTEQQRQEFENGQGGALAPLMCVDKSPQELDSFAALSREAAQFEQPWGLVFAAAMSGAAPGQPPCDVAIDQALQGMVENLKQGRIDGYIPFDQNGLPVRIEQKS